MNGYYESFRGHVLSSECDLIGHMNIQYYGACVSQAMQSMFQRIGFPAQMMTETQKGFAAVDQKSRYCGELLAGDIMHMMSAITEFSEKSVIFHHRLINSATEELSFESHVTTLHFDLSARKVIPFDKATLDLLSEMKTEAPS